MTGTLYEHRHTNGWFATAEATADGLFKANAHQVGDTTPRWATQRIPDLQTAQQIADARVPPHECQCAGWIKSA